MEEQPKIKPSAAQQQQQQQHRADRRESADQQRVKQADGSNGVSKTQAKQGQDTAGSRYSSREQKASKEQAAAKAKAGTSSQQQAERPQKAATKAKNSFVCSGTTFNVDSKYEYIKQVGHGAYGVVCSAYDHVRREKIAIKKVPKAFEDLIDAKRIVREIRLLKFFDQKNIINVVDVLKPPAPTGFEDIYIVTELMETDMHRVIYSRQELTDEHMQYFMHQLLSGTLYLHSANIIHRDLKPSNVLLNKNCELKICDFGLARGYEEEKIQDGLTEYVVTRWYRAPEVILSATHYTKALDVWSIGCIFAELLGRAPLFPGDDYLDQIKRTIGVLGTPTTEDKEFIVGESERKFLRKQAKRSKQDWNKIYPNANPTALDLLGKMLVFNPYKRYSVEECLDHMYFENYMDEPREESETIFDWKWDDFEPTKEILQKMVYKESLDFHTEDEP